MGIQPPVPTLKVFSRATVRVAPPQLRTADSVLLDFYEVL